MSEEVASKPRMQLETQVAVLTERVEQSQKQSDKRMDVLEKKLDDVLSRFVTKEDQENRIKPLEEKVAKLNSYLEWLIKGFGTLVVGGLGTLFFKSGVLHS